MAIQNPNTGCMTTTTEIIKRVTPGPIQLIAETAVFSVRMSLWTVKRALLTVVGEQ